LSFLHIAASEGKQEKWVQFSIKSITEEIKTRICTIIIYISYSKTMLHKLISLMADFNINTKLKGLLLITKSQAAFGDREEE
jgi:hypothetical protein